jgi:5'-nucleotidase
MPMNPWKTRLFCNRTLNLRPIRAIGYDMDYTLVEYHAEQWEERAYEYLKQRLIAQGWPVEEFRFDPRLVCRGLLIDVQQGNLVKANRFGFIKRAMHGTQVVEHDAMRALYARTIADSSDRRWVFLNTLFSLSEGCMYAQLIDLLDQKRLPGVVGYEDLYRRVRNAVDSAHAEGRLKAEILATPQKFIRRNPETAQALLDQKFSGKKLLLITNSEWSYTQAVMNYCFDPYLPKDLGWRKLFDVIIVGARKPVFFTTASPFFEVVSEDGHLLPSQTPLKPGSAYLGGSARELEQFLGLSGDEILYVGDHMFGDVHVSKDVLRWRTALILDELESEIEAIEAFAPKQALLDGLMQKKEDLEFQLSDLRLELHRSQLAYTAGKKRKPEAVQAEIDKLRKKVLELDQELTPLAQASSELNQPLWGLLMRAGNDKSYLAFQMERYADIYTSRVSNFLYATPFAFLRSGRGMLPHER